MSLVLMCKIDNCEKKVFGRGWCSMHWGRWKKYGSPHTIKRTPNGEPMRFLMETVKTHSDECVIWPYARVYGYGKIYHDGFMQMAHRLALVFYGGVPANPKLEAAHNCGKGSDGCMNPRHLEWKTPYENSQDKKRHGTYVRGSKVNGAKLKESQVKSIRADQRPVAEIAKDYGVKYRTVHAIKRRENWGWL